MVSCGFILERHYRSTGGESYIDMHPVTPENNNVFQDDGQPEAPPPLPVKKYSMQRQNFADHIYENVPFVYINNGKENFDFVFFSVIKNFCRFSLHFSNLQF